MIKVVFVDIDNTLLSFSGYVKQTMKDGFAYFGLPSYEPWMYDTFNEINNGLWKALERGELTFEELIAIRWNKVFESLQFEFDGIVFEDYFRKQLSNSAILEAGAVELLEYLSEKYVLCVASNGPYEQQVKRLKIGNIYDYFSHYFVSERVGAQKPSKEFFDYCFKELREQGLENISPEETMMIGDSLTADIAGGKQYGMATCLYLCGKGSVEGSDAADYVVKELTEIKSIL